MQRLKIITSASTAAALLLAVRLFWTTEPVLAAKDLLGLVVFFGMMLLIESKPLRLPDRKEHPGEIILSGLSSYALVALFGALPGALVGAVAALMGHTLLRRAPVSRALFDTSRIFLALAAAGVIYRWRLGFGDGLVGDALATACALAAYFILDRALLRLAQGGGKPRPRAERWRDLAASTLIALCVVPLGLLLTLAYDRLWIAAPVLFCGPLFLMRESYAQYVRLKVTYMETVRTLVRVIETHDTYTAGHSLRVAEYAKRLALALKLPRKEVEKIEIAAYLHDLGKVDLAITNLVRKPGRLTDEERRRVELHPLVSAELAAQVTLFRGEIEEIIRRHHENHDGTGYPGGLRGDEIPLGARIIHVVDAFDAMTSSRVYRPARELEGAKDELRRFSGFHFEPDLVAVFIEACVADESAMIPQVEPAYEETLEAQLLEMPVIPEEIDDPVQELLRACA
jgi:putative nucleotidyltransferase with HDIG domain